MADEAGRVHQDVAAAVVRSEAGEALLVQGLRRHTRLPASRRDPRRLLPHRQGRRGRPQQAERLRALHQDRDHVLHRRYGEGEGGLDQLHRALHRPALAIRHRFRGRRLRQ